MPRIINLTKAEMLARFGKPYFGYTKGQTIYLCSDLPKRVRDSVLVHETQHVNDKAFQDGRVWHWEFRAWQAQAKADFVGMLYTIWLSVINPARLKLYWQRLVKGF